MLEPVRNVAARFEGGDGQRRAQQRVVAAEEADHLVAQRVAAEDGVVIGAHLLRQRGVEDVRDGRIEQIAPRFEDGPQPRADAGVEFGGPQIFRVGGEDALDLLDHAARSLEETRGAAADLHDFGVGLCVAERRTPGDPQGP